MKYSLLLLCLVILSCQEGKHVPPAIAKGFLASEFALKNGDILFQDLDCGVFCDAIEKVTFGYKGSKFSHVGFLLTNGDDKFQVLEANTDGVVTTEIDSFFLRSQDQLGRSKVVVGRLKEQYQSLIPNALSHALSLRGSKYDDVFDIENDQYYCSELIYESLKKANDGIAVFPLQEMTFIDPDTKKTFPIWTDYYKDLGTDIPEGDLGLNPGGISTSPSLEIVHIYGHPQGYTQ